MEEKRRQKPKEKKEINKWKWAFLLLLSLLLFLIFFFIRLLNPSSIEESEEIDKTQSEEIEITSNINKKDAEFIMNNYLNTQKESKNISYKIRIEDTIQLSSKIKIMNLELPLTISFLPYSTEKGNLQLRAESMKLASLSLPVSSVLAILANQMNLPHYIQIDSDQKMIVVNFNDLKEYYPYRIEIDKIDLENNDIKLKLFVNKDTLIRALDYEKEIRSNSDGEKTEK